MAPRIDLLTHSRNRAMNRLHTILLASGSLVLLVFLVTDSQPHANEYGLPSRGAADLEG